MKIVEIKTIVINNIQPYRGGSLWLFVQLITDAGIIALEVVCDPDAPWAEGFGAPGLENDVLAVAVFDDDGSGPNPPAIFAAGKFDYAGGAPANGIAKWNGLNWEPLIDVDTNVAGLEGIARDLLVFNTDPAGLDPPSLFVAGDFINAGLRGPNKIARWDGIALDGRSRRQRSGVDRARSRACLSKDDVPDKKQAVFRAPVAVTV